jgi:glycosyltransferase involved in cell wall biosynthesis
VPCDVQAATHALQTLIEDRARAQEMGQRGKQWAAEHLPWSVVGRQMAEAYEEIIRHHSGSFQASAPVPLIQ